MSFNYYEISLEFFQMEKGGCFLKYFPTNSKYCFNEEQIITLHTKNRLLNDQVFE